MKREIDATNIPVGQPSDIKMNGNELTTDHTIIESPQLDKTMQRMMAELAFMDEFVDVVVQESNDPCEENPVTVGCNGAFIYLYRGKPATIKRKFLNNLIVKRTHISTPEYTNPVGERAYSIRQRHALKYPFMVLKDPNPKGGEWLRHRMAELV